jgi:Sigma-70, region 4
MFPMLPSQFVPNRPHHDAAWNELRPVFHDEVRRLPDKYRIPVILSYLEGRTNEDVAELLHWPVGTVKGRLAKARELLRTRLVRRGMTLSAAFLATALADGVIFAEVVPQELVTRTISLVRRFKTSPALPGSPLSPKRPLTKSNLQNQRGAPIDTSRRHPSFLNVPLVVLISLLSVVTVIGIAVAFDGGDSFSYLSSAFSALLRARTAGLSCP